MAPVHMPMTVRISLCLLVAAVLATPLIGMLDSAPTPTLPEGAGPAVIAATLFLVAFLGLVAFVAVMAYRRRNWARWVHGALFVLGLAVYIPTMVATFESSSSSVLSLIVTAAEVASVVLLFTRDSNAWYSSRCVAAA